ncbi:MAG: secondary thiamine-phosphate synthase enzyme YjbQ [Sphaerochaetaceae bacterium]|nr:secondary thiamine-phosphate synthase enzyme YjbQ [Sphaerochaetaceae bacterium]NLO59806.1 YjbQ family protein [Spirochaetales bacterium]MDD2405732.1 secondary thiamine-phosphate synthase enzyme YjbQ [Sphaerochaetaceae bacterium]MDD3670629.1 secondary thiamine-phosphate synthase enzyme YjbQ [Sphaerochaetaceae bacterium]MDD4259626.1 secondary thiamine-phosphate synthase enzyme YjbQ [Sphaerochaetaceae bacterium]
MKVYRESIKVQSAGRHPTFHDVTKEVKEILKKSQVKQGICIVYSHHTTCSVMTQECSHDKTYYDLEFLQQDLCNIMEKLVPTCRVEGQYMHPGPKHIEFAMSVGEEGEWTSLNTEAHLRSVIFGRSESIVIVDGELDLGEFGYVYFVDWDQIRARPRTVQVQIIGE